MNGKKATIMSLSAIAFASAVALSALGQGSPAFTSPALATTSTKTVTLNNEDEVAYDSEGGYYYVAENQDGQTHDKIRSDVISVDGEYQDTTLYGIYTFGYLAGEDYFFKMSNIPALTEILYYDGLVLGFKNIQSFTLTYRTTMLCSLALTVRGGDSPTDSEGFADKFFSDDLTEYQGTLGPYSYDGAHGEGRYIRIQPFYSAEASSGTYDFTITSLFVTWSC